MSDIVFERVSDRVLVFLLILLGAFALSLVDASFLRDARQPALMQRGALVDALRLSDLCLFPEARYTRHPSQADLHSPFQDHPFALEHFPTGSLFPPPEHWAPGREQMESKGLLPDAASMP